MHRITETTGWVCRNYGVSGTRIARQSKASANTKHDLDFNARIPCMDPDADLIVVFGGTNDFGRGDAPLGGPEDKGVYSFYGAVQSLYDSLKVHFPGKPIVVVTPLHRFRPEDELLNPCLVEYVRIIQEIAIRNELPVLNLYDNSKIHPRTENVREQYVPDGLHPNNDGHAILAEEILEFLKNL